MHDQHIVSFQNYFFYCFIRSTRNLFIRQASHQPPASSPLTAASDISFTLYGRTVSNRLRSHTVTEGVYKRRDQSTNQDQGQRSTTDNHLNPLSTDPVSNREQYTLETTEDATVSATPRNEEVNHEIIDDEEVKSKIPTTEERKEITSEGYGVTPIQSDVTIETENRLASRQSSIDDELRQCPGFKFITRPDLYKFVKVCTHVCNLSMLYI